MSGLVEKVKDAVRSRSKNRQSSSLGSQGLISSEFHHGLSSNESPLSSSLPEGPRSRDPGARKGIDSTAQDFAGLSVNDQSTQKSTQNLPSRPSDASRNSKEAITPKDTRTNGIPGQTQHRRPVSGDLSKPRTPTHRRGVSNLDDNFEDARTGLEDAKVSPEAIPARRSSLRRKPLPESNTENRPPLPAASANIFPGQKSPTRHKKGRSVDVAPKQTSPLVPHFTTKSAAHPTSSSAAGQSDREFEGNRKDLRLPATFDLGHSQRTHVDTTVAPAVTAETIHHHTTEVVAKAVTRDVHIDHFFHYVQPIPVREVLPAKHYALDPKTGQKTEIPAPAGWQMPPELQPRKAEDLSHLQQTTRHYVVDEEHPTGRVE